MTPFLPYWLQYILLIFLFHVAQSFFFKSLRKKHKNSKNANNISLARILLLTIILFLFAFYSILFFNSNIRIPDSLLRKTSFTEYEIPFIIQPISFYLFNLALNYFIYYAVILAYIIIIDHKLRSKISNIVPLEEAKSINKVVLALSESKEKIRIRANSFLTLTIILGFIFSALLLYLGNSLININTTGNGGKINEISKKFDLLLEHTGNGLDERIRINRHPKLLLLSEDLIEGFTVKYYSFEDLNLKDYLNKFDNIYIYSKNKVVDSLVTVVNEGYIIDYKDIKQNEEAFRANYYSSLPYLKNLLIIGLEVLKGDYTKEELSNYSQTLMQLKIRISISSIEKKIGRLIDEINLILAYEALPRTLASTESLMKDIKLNYDSDKNQTSELIKRLVVSLIVVSFFLAILRFCASQYKQAIRDLNDIESKTIDAEKLSIAMSELEDDKRSKQPVIDALIQSSAAKKSLDKKEAKNENISLKELLTFLSKKI